MNIAAAWQCYDCAKSAGNREAALRHLHRIRAALKKSNKQSKPDQENIPAAAPSDRVRSIFDYS